MKKWTQIRLDVLRNEVSKREIIRREGLHWETLKKVLTHPQPPGYRMKEARPKPKIGPYLERIAQIIDEDKGYPKKQANGESYRLRQAKKRSKHRSPRKQVSKQKET